MITFNKLHRTTAHEARQHVYLVQANKRFIEMHIYHQNTKKATTHLTKQMLAMNKHSVNTRKRQYEKTLRSMK